MKRLLLYISMLSLMFSCKKTEIDSLQVATVSWHGPYEVDGCAYFVEIDGTEFKPINEEIFGEKYQSGQPVKIKLNYIETGDTELVCGLLLQTSPAIRIYSYKEI